MWLSSAEFEKVVASTPLFSIDLVVRNVAGEILLGRRTNRPAQNFWFVPGGRVLKNETLDSAFTRLSRKELGVRVERSQCGFLGLYEHFYEDSVFGDRPSTHYIVAGYLLDRVSTTDMQLPLEEHIEYRWWRKGEIAASPEVHENTKLYLPSIQRQ